MKDKFMNFFGIEKGFKKEFRRQIRSFVVVFLGFTIAFTWRQTISDLSQSLVRLITDIKDSSVLSIISSILITLVCISIIYLTAHFLKEEYD